MATEVLVNIGSGIGLFGANTLPDPMMNNCRFDL